MFSKIFASIAIISFLVLPALTLAAATPTVPVEGEVITFSKIENLVKIVIRYITIFASLLVLGVFIYAGVLWVTAGDNQTKVTKAKALFKNAVIGALIVFGVGVIMNTIADFARQPTQIVR